MLFNSCQFVVFFLMVTALFHALGHRFRWPMLLLASCYFYAVFVPKYLLVLAIIIVIDYVAGLLIEGSLGFRRRMFLGVSIAANLGILAFFKYGNFAQVEAHRVLTWFGFYYEPHLYDIILPIGLSFHTFQSISYTVEVYRKNQVAERHFGLYALYVLFYPQMVAGPIERPQNVLPQLHEMKSFDGDLLVQGIGWIIWGAFKKMIVADNLTVLVDPIYAAPARYHGWPLILATYAFAFQIYCDFSGYSDIARGAALTMGFRLMKNFDVPYHARSISEFWRRWHISLSTWFRDYLYIPLGGNRFGRLMTFRNLMIVFVVSGLWHGASWAFVIWGALHGSYLVCEMITAPQRQRLWSARWMTPFVRGRPLISMLVTFHLVWFAWIFFRAGSLQMASLVIRGLFDFSVHPVEFPNVLTQFQLLGLVLGLVTMEAIHLFQTFDQWRFDFDRWPLPARCVVLSMGLLSVAAWGRLEATDFIYFQF